MKMKEFKKTDEFKTADIVLYYHANGVEFDGTHNQLERKKVICTKWCTDRLNILIAVIE